MTGKQIIPAPWGRYFMALELVDEATFDRVVLPERMIGR